MIDCPYYLKRFKEIRGMIANNNHSAVVVYCKRVPVSFLDFMITCFSRLVGLDIIRVIFSTSLPFKLECVRDVSKIRS